MSKILDKDKMTPSPTAAPSSSPPLLVPLFGCCVAVSGYFRDPPGTNQASVLLLAEALGATVSKSITAQTTHLVTTQADCDKTSTKAIQARKGGIFIVGLGWILESEAIGTRQSETDYILTVANHKAATTKPPTGTAATSQKRQPSHSPAPDPKKNKLSTAIGKAPAIGKSQIAKDWAVRIPLDTGCPLSGYGVHVDDDSVIWDASLK